MLDNLNQDLLLETFEPFPVPQYFVLQDVTIFCMYLFIFNILFIHLLNRDRDTEIEEKDRNVESTTHEASPLAGRDKGVEPGSSAY